MPNKNWVWIGIVLIFVIFGSNLGFFASFSPPPEYTCKSVPIVVDGQYDYKVTAVTQHRHTTRNPLIQLRVIKVGGSAISPSSCPYTYSGTCYLKNGESAVYSNLDTKSTYSVAEMECQKKSTSTITEPFDYFTSSGCSLMDAPTCLTSLNCDWDWSNKLCKDKSTTIISGKYYCIDFDLVCRGYETAKSDRRCFDIYTDETKEKSNCESRIPKCGDGNCDSTYESVTTCNSDCKTSPPPIDTCLPLVKSECILNSECVWSKIGKCNLKSSIKCSDISIESCVEKSGCDIKSASLTQWLPQCVDKEIIPEVTNQTGTPSVDSGDKLDFDKILLIIGIFLAFVVVIKILGSKK